jgi:uncharacterized membrane protein
MSNRKKLPIDHAFDFFNAIGVNPVKGILIGVPLTLVIGAGYASSLLPQSAEEKTQARVEELQSQRREANREAERKAEQQRRDEERKARIEAAEAERQEQMDTYGMTNQDFKETCRALVYAHSGSKDFGFFNRGGVEEKMNSLFMQLSVYGENIYGNDIEVQYKCWKTGQENVEIEKIGVKY